MGVEADDSYVSFVRLEAERGGGEGSIGNGAAQTVARQMAPESRTASLETDLARRQNEVAVDDQCVFPFTFSIHTGTTGSVFYPSEE